jgi:DNA-binding NarL/FixJ family response regulator
MVSTATNSEILMALTRWEPAVKECELTAATKWQPSAQEARLMLDMLRAGKSKRAIAAFLNVSEDTLRRFLNRLEAGR